MLAELHIQRIQDFCFLECLVLNATTYDRTQDYHGTQPNSDSKGGKESAHVFKEKKANESNASVNRSLGQSTSFAEEDAEEVGSVEEEIDDHDSDAPEDFSQLEDGAKSPQAPPRVETENKHSPVDSPVRPSYGLTNSGRLDESSSFEADSPAKVQMQADFKQTAVLTNRDHKVATTADVDDSFAEDSVHDSVQEEMDESSQQGPEYDSDSHSSHHSDHKQDRKGASSPLPPVAVATKNLNATADAKQLAQSPDASKDEQDVPATEDASSPEVEVEVALARATAEDFDRVDRSGVDQDMATRRSNVRNRVAVQRAGQPAEGKSADGDAAGAKASVFRLGQVLLYCIHIRARQRCLIIVSFNYRAQFRDPHWVGAILPITWTPVRASKRMSAATKTKARVTRRPGPPGAAQGLPVPVRAPATPPPARWKPCPSSQQTTSARPANLQ